MRKNVMKLLMVFLATTVFGLTGCGGGGSNSVATPTTVANIVPVANAGAVQNVVTGAVVTLDGSASSDANGDLLTYSWSFTSKPVGSNAALSSSTAAKPTFTADVAGAYVLSLIVNDGKVSSSASTVTISASVANAAPVANAGVAQSVVTGAVITLDASTSSDANGDILTYRWEFTSKPAGSTATLSSTTAAKPTFTTDVAGAYVLNLVVNDGKTNSNATTVTVTATATPKLLNVAYKSRTGLSVTLTSFNKVDTGGYNEYTAIYTVKNETVMVIGDGQSKLYLSDGTDKPQYGFFGDMYPGETKTRSATFRLLYTETPTILEFDDVFASTPVGPKLQWSIPIQN